MKRFKQYLLEAQSTWPHIASAAGLTPMEMPGASKHAHSNSAHGWLDSDGTFWHSPQSHDLSAFRITNAANPGSGKQGSPGIKQVMKDHAARIAGQGAHLGVQSHHPLTDAQQNVLRHAMKHKGYQSFCHEHGDSFDATDVEKPTFHKDLPRLLKLGHN